MENQQRWLSSNFKNSFSTFRSSSSSHPSTAHLHNVARYYCQKMLFGPNRLNYRCSKWGNQPTLAETVASTLPVFFVLTASKTLNTEDTGPENLCFWLLIYWYSTYKFINIRLLSFKFHTSLTLGTRWVQVWEAVIVIVETLRLGKSTHTVPLMFWALRSFCVCLQ